MNQMRLTEAMIVLSLVSAVFANEKPLVIEQTISTNKQLSPTKLQTSFSFSKDGQNPNKILSSFKEINSAVVSFNATQKGKCSGGGNSIYPQFQYIDNKQQFQGYMGNVTYNCLFEDIEEYNSLLKTSFVNKNKITLTPLDWIVPEELTKSSIKEAQKQLVLDAIGVANEYGTTLKKECKLVSINFIGNQDISNHQMVRTLATMDVGEMGKFNNYEPIKRAQTIHIQGNIAVECGER
jgi:hypothetical protein